MLPFTASSQSYLQFILELPLCLAPTFPMPPLSSTLIALQGIFGIINGAATLLFPAAAQKNLETLQLDATALPAVHAIALASITVGSVQPHLVVDKKRRIICSMFGGNVDD